MPCLALRPAPPAPGGNPHVRRKEIPEKKEKPGSKETKTEGAKDGMMMINSEKKSLKENQPSFTNPTLVCNAVENKTGKVEKISHRKTDTGI